MQWPANETFEIYVDDERYGVPTLHLIPAENELMALRIARHLLAECPHHVGVEICLAGQRLTGLGTYASRRAAADPSESQARP